MRLIILKMELVLIVLLVLLNTSCSWLQPKQYKSPGVPLIGFSFDTKFDNDGILNVDILKDINLSYDKGISDSCLNLTKTSTYRLPLSVSFPDQYNVDDYEGFTVLFWVKKPSDDIEDYMVVSCYKEDYFNNFIGWKIFANATGAWRWEMSDGKDIFKYNPGFPRQAINDNQWHFVGFTYNNGSKEVRHYFDGAPVAVISVEECDSLYHDGNLAIGGNINSFEKRRDSFNGYIDEFSYWGRTLSKKEIEGLWVQKTKEVVKERSLAGNNFSVLTWNIYQGGEYLGKTVGIDRIVEIIKNTGADIICVQETYRGGEKIADRLGFYFYRRSDNLSVISRFPIETTFNIFKKEHAGGVLIQLDELRSIVVYPIWLSPQPDIGAYVKSGIVSVDSLVLWEQNTRGMEMRFILSEIPRWNRDNSARIIIAGNFNTGSHLDWTERNKDNHNGMVIPFTISKMLQESGFKDSYREIYPDEVKYPGSTWSPLFKEIFSDRVDYIYYKGDKLKAVKSSIIDHHRFGFPSDQALVITEFELFE